MANDTARARPGVLFELLKTKGMTQQGQGATPKTLVKIDRGEEVKLETLQKVATKLRVPVSYFTHPAAAADDSEAPSKLEPGIITLRKLDAAGLEDLVKGGERLRWLLKAQVRDDAARAFLEEFEQAVDNFQAQLIREQMPDAYDVDSSLRSQLKRLNSSDDIAARLERLADHGVALLGADYLFWDHSSEDGEYEDNYWTDEKYDSRRIVLLSVDPVGTQSRRVRVFQGSLPPTYAPPSSRGRKINVSVNGISLPDQDDVIPF